MSSSTRRHDLSPSRGGVGSSKLRMDRQPLVARISDPSLTIGKRKEIDNVMKKARAGASTNEYWDKKLLEVEEKDPNRWRHTGYKKMYIEGESSSDSDDSYHNNKRKSRSRSRNRKISPSPPMRRRSPERRRSPKSPSLRHPRSPVLRRRPRSPPEPLMRRKSPRSPRSPTAVRRTSIPPPLGRRRSPPPSLVSKQRASILSRSKRPPSPPPKADISASNSSVTSCSDDSCSVCSPKTYHGRSRSTSNTRIRNGPKLPHVKQGYNRKHETTTHQSPPPIHHLKGRIQKSTHMHASSSSSSSSSIRQRPISPVQNRGDDKQRLVPSKHRTDEKVTQYSLPDKITLRSNRIALSSRHLVEETFSESSSKVSSRSTKIPSTGVPEDPRLKPRPPEPPKTVVPKKVKEKTLSAEKIRAKVKIEGEKRKKTYSSESDDSSSSEGSVPTFAATTNLTLSERFGKMAQWSVDRSNIENMRITKDSAGGAVKVMIEEDSPPRRHSYSPAPVGHFPKELATTAPTGLMSWDDVRVRYEYYKSRGYLRDLDLKDYVKWEEWWYRYQEWLKQERYYEFYERQQMNRRRRKKIPISQRLN